MTLSLEILAKNVLFDTYYTLFLYYDVLYCTVLYCTVLYCTVLYCTVLYCTVPSQFSSFTSSLTRRTVLYSIVQHCTVQSQFSSFTSSSTRRKAARDLYYKLIWPCLIARRNIPKYPKAFPTVNQLLHGPLRA